MSSSYSKQQLINATKGMSLSVGGLNITEIKQYLSEHGIDNKGTRKELEQKLYQVLTREKSESQATERSARQATERSARQLAERSTRQAAERSARQLVERSARQATERSARQATERSARQATERSARQATERSARQAAERSARQAAERSARQAAERSARQLAERSARQATERSARQATERSARQQEQQDQQDQQEQEHEDPEIKKFFRAMNSRTTPNISESERLDSYKQYFAKYDISIPENTVQTFEEYTNILAGIIGEKLSTRNYMYRKCYTSVFDSGIPDINFIIDRTYMISSPEEDEDEDDAEAEAETGNQISAIYSIAFKQKYTTLAHALLGIVYTNPDGSLIKKPSIKLDAFNNDSKIKGLGKRLVCKALRLLTENNIITPSTVLTLCAGGEWNTRDGKKLDSLVEYYEKNLGAEVDPKYNYRYVDGYNNLPPNINCVEMFTTVGKLLSLCDDL